MGRGGKTQRLQAARGRPTCTGKRSRSMENIINAIMGYLSCGLFTLTAWAAQSLVWRGIQWPWDVNITCLLVRDTAIVTKLTWAAGQSSQPLSNKHISGITQISYNIPISYIYRFYFLYFQKVYNSYIYRPLLHIFITTYIGKDALVTSILEAEQTKLSVLWSHIALVRGSVIINNKWWFNLDRHIQIIYE